MRVRIAALVLLLALVPSAAGALPFKAKLTAATHTPTINTKWRYSVRVTNLKGQAITAKVTVQIVDPLGGVHPVEYGCCAKKFVTNVRIKGRFRDWVQYPLAAKGYRITFKVTVKTARGTRVVTYWIKTI